MASNDEIWGLGELLPDVADRILVIGSGCWEWQGGISNGYGKFGRRINGAQVTFMVHRYVWRTLVGSIPDGFQVDHLCRNRRCCNPDHLEPVTPQENLSRIRYTRPMPTQCPHGHPYTPENIVVKPCDGRLRCRLCINRHTRAYQRRKRLREMAKPPETITEEGML